ncbi:MULTISPECIES: AbrB/MazE/SpoVT family DNA-binding domain-containing protein [unclassified Planococcus (in: firmicutes)]|uniref:AbrB/MazE/SpoVT family DNA-binding domain-containing protein n=2 Tax=Planococcus TaxID=1372 RepID=UPI0021532D6F|nr:MULTISPECIES: AbrB/MazE/SpoVT family DNA-binding domain-containing protein [unclassified Planococcus (in: firmicutes)]
MTAKLTSKGQVTLPKTVRDMLKLNSGDHLDFVINRPGEVVMKKNSELNLAKETSFNLVQFLINKFPVLTITGNVASGKTTFAADLLIQDFSQNFVALLEPRDELYSLVGTHMENLYNLELRDFNMDFLKENAIDFLVIDEFSFFNAKSDKITEYLSDFVNGGLRIIIISQSIDSPVRTELGEHFNLHLERNEVGTSTSVDHFAEEKGQLFSKQLLKVNL